MTTSKPIKVLFFPVLLYFTMGLGLLSFSACSDEVTPLAEIRLDLTFDIPAGLNSIETHYFTFENIPLFYLQNLLVRGINSESVKSVSASRGTLISLDNNTPLDIVRRISIFAVNPDDLNDKQEMFYLDQVPFNQGRELRMLTSISELKSIMEKDRCHIEIRLDFKTFTSIPMRCRLDYGYSVFGI